MNYSKDLTELRRLLSEKRRQGQLPRISTSRTWAGDGTGAACLLCEFPIERGQIEYEVEWRDGHATQLLRFHELCYRLCSES
jgi:hypothetical protein